MRLPGLLYARKKLPLKALTLGISAAALTLACTPTGAPFSSLVDQGLIPVSPDNPYVGSNLFLGKEMEESTYLYNFLRSTGAPEAIELDGDTSAPDVRFFYAKNREYYEAHPHIDPERHTKEWIIRGPYAIDRNYFRQVSRLPVHDSAVFEIWGRKERFGTTAEPKIVRELRPAFVPTPTPKPTPRPKPKPKIVITAIPATPTPSAPLNFDQKALIEAKGLAERAPSGDLVHIVKAPTETLQSIANWYTLSAENAAKIADKNGIAADAQLRPGNRLLIPSELVKNPKSMP